MKPINIFGDENSRPAIIIMPMDLGFFRACLADMQSYYRTAPLILKEHIDKFEEIMKGIDEQIDEQIYGVTHDRTEEKTPA